MEESTVKVIKCIVEELVEKELKNNPEFFEKHGVTKLDFENTINLIDQYIVTQKVGWKFTPYSFCIGCGEYLPGQECKKEDSCLHMKQLRELDKAF